MSTTTASPEGSSLSSDPLTPGERSLIDSTIDDLAGLIPRAVEQNDAGTLGMTFDLLRGDIAEVLRGFVMFAEARRELETKLWQACDRAQSTLERKAS